MRFEELAADFVEGEGGSLWFISVRGFRLVNGFDDPLLSPFVLVTDEEEERVYAQRRLGRGKRIHHEKLRMCRLCQVGYTEAELAHELTLTMILRISRTL